MAHLPMILRMPRELRDMIIDSILLSRRPAPPIPASGTDPAQVGRTRLSDFDARDLCSAVYWDASNFRENWPGAGLLNSCSILRADARKRLSSLTVPHVLDLIIVDHRTVWATWLATPPKNGPCIEKLEVDIRIAGAWRPQGGIRDVFRVHGLHDATFSDMLRRILMRILAMGNLGNIPVHVRHLVINRDIARHWYKNPMDTDYVPQFAIKHLALNVHPEVPLAHDEHMIEKADEGEETYLQIHNGGQGGNPHLVLHPRAFLQRIESDLEELFSLQMPNAFAEAAPCLVGEGSLVFGAGLVRSWNYSNFTNFDESPGDNDRMKRRKAAIRWRREIYGLRV